MLQVYSTNKCPYCVAAKKLLEQKNIPYKEHIIGIHILKETFVERFPEQKTVPLILDDDGFIIGGYDKLSEWVRNQGSQELLQG